MRDYFGLRKFIERPDCVLKRSYRLQLLATLVVNIIGLTHGIGVGWLSPTLSKLQSPESPLSFEVNTEQASWIGSLLGLGSLFGNLLFGTVIDLVGRKKCIYAVALPTVSIWLLIYFAQSVEYLYVARFLCGCTGGSVYVILPIFISEIADKNIRGTIATTLMLSVNLGVLIGFVLSTHLDYHVMPLVVVSLPIIYLLGTLFFPETPQHLIRKNKHSEAIAAFFFYKNCTEQQQSTEQHAVQQYHQEFQHLKMVLTTGSTSEKFTYHDFFNCNVMKSFATALVILVVNQFCGLFAFINYMSYIFAESGSPLDPDTSTILMGAVQIFGVYAATIFADKCGRKSLMLSSVGGVAVGVLLMGFFTYYGSKALEDAWIPLALMTIVVFLGNMGLVALTFVVLVEIFPAKIRSIAASMCMAVLSIFVFIVLKVFPVFMITFGISVTMWSCGSIAAVSFVYLYFFLPETKGKSMEE